MTRALWPASWLMTIGDKDVAIGRDQHRIGFMEGVLPVAGDARLARGQRKTLAALVEFDHVIADVFANVAVRDPEVIGLVDGQPCGKSIFLEPKALIKFPRSHRTPSPDRARSLRSPLAPQRSVTQIWPPWSIATATARSRARGPAAIGRSHGLRDRDWVGNWECCRQAAAPLKGIGSPEPDDDNFMAIPA